MNDLCDVKAIREKLGISQEEFAKRLGVSSRTVQNWEFGKKIPDSKHEIFAKVLQRVQVNDLVTPFFNGLFQIVLDVLVFFPVQVVFLTKSFDPGAKPVVDCHLQRLR